MKEKMKFDVVIGNPPYKGRLHLKFLNVAYRLCERWIVWVQPGGWIFNKSGKTSIYENTKDLIDGKIKEIDLFSFRKYFSIRFHAPGAILFIDKNKNIKDPILVSDQFHDKRVSYYNSIRELNVWNDTVIFPGLQNKIINFCKTHDTFSNHIDKNEGSFYIKREIIAGGPNVTEDKRFQTDFFYVTVKNPKVLKNKPEYWFSFKTEKEANNCLNFLHSSFGRFCVSLRKIDQNMSKYQWKAIPWMNWEETWNDEKLFKYFNLDDSEIKFIIETMDDFDWFKK